MSNTISGVSAATQQYTDYSSVTSKQAEKKQQKPHQPIMAWCMKSLSLHQQIRLHILSIR